VDGMSLYRIVPSHGIYGIVPYRTLVLRSDNNSRFVSVSSNVWYHTMPDDYHREKLVLFLSLPVLAISVSLLFGAGCHIIYMLFNK
jgi:hypothetical protein